MDCGLNAGESKLRAPPSQLVTNSCMAYQPDPRDVKQLVTLSHRAVQWLWGAWGSSDDLLGATRTVFYLFDLSSWASSNHDGLRAISRDNLASGLREKGQKLKGLLGPQLRNVNITSTACDWSRPATLGSPPSLDGRSGKTFGAISI